MKNNSPQFSALKQYLLGIGVLILVLGLGQGLNELAGYRVVGFMLLLAVSILAVFLDLWPVLLITLLSALSWDYFFMPPRFTLSIGNTDDRLMLLTYFLVAMIHSVFTFKIRQTQRELKSREIKMNTVRYYNILLNSLSHELKTPITTIIGTIDNLQSNASRISEQDRAELLSEISTAAIRLNEQVENLLSMSRLESGVFEVKKDWVDVRELVNNTLRRLEPAILQWRVSVLIPESLPLFKLDYGLMLQVLHNLVNNVMQHTPAGTDISIRADCVEEKLLLAVGDTGKGFPESDLDRVFEKFYRVKGSKPGGTGLGLSIVKGFVEAHQGKVTLRNMPLSGAEFTIEIPTEVSYLNRLKNE